MHAARDREVGELVLPVERPHRSEVRRQRRILADVETGQIGDHRLVVGAGELEVIRRESRRAIVEILRVEPDIAVAELPCDVELDLAAFIAVEADVARPLALTIEAADMEAQVLAEL